MKNQCAVLVFGVMGCAVVAAQPVSTTPTTSAQTQPLQSEQWRYSITPYAWALGISGSIAQNGTSLGNVSVSSGDVLRDLKMAGMIVAQAHRGRYGLYLDAMYGDLGSTDSKVVQDTSLSANTSIKMSMVTLAPSYNLHNSPALNLDALAGGRFFWQDATTTISATSLGQSISESSRITVMDAVVGLKGQWNLGNSDYFVPFYVDVGAGNRSSFTTQAYAGIGRTFDWGDLSLVAKNVYYQFTQNNTNVDMNLFGAAVAVTFRF